jgi:glucosamine-6-phosphate deaminase
MPEARLQVLVHPAARDAARAAARFVARNVRTTSDLVLGLPTGRTMIPVYDELTALHRLGRLPLDSVTAFNLDEFEGLAPGDPGSFRAYMHTHFYGLVRMRRGACRFPPVNGRDPAAYDQHISRAGGLDLCLLGLGANGHIGFNEPGPALAAHTHRVRLQPATRRANAYLFEGRVSRVPTHAVSMGMATMLQARAVALIATGAGKAAIVRRALTGPITTRVPASLIQAHPHAIVFLDRDAAALLNK